MGKSFVYNTGSSDDDKLADELRLEFGVFIDGTLNNKTNKEMRDKYGRGGETGDVNKDLTNEEIEKNDEAAYKNVKNKDRIAELTSKEYRSPNEEAELRSFPEKDRYLVASHRGHFNPLTFNFSTDKLGTDNSYSNDYTNVARMWTCCENKKYAVYVEGMGTEGLLRDSQDGFAFGSGRTGIRGRVRNACEQVAQKIFDQTKGKDTILTQITFDAFGFSRGAASARNFVYEVNAKKSYAPRTRSIQEGYYPPNPKTGTARPKYKDVPCDHDGVLIDTAALIDGKLPRMGHLGYCLIRDKIVTPQELEDIQVIVRFLGVYDTVSSYFENKNDGGLGQYDANGEIIDDNGGVKIASQGVFTNNFHNDVEELQLNSFGYVQKVVHFTAKDEHRKNFDLTRVKNANSLERIIEKNFPGVHCDVGGAYENEPEVVEKLETVYWVGDLEALRKQLIKEYWFTDRQIETSGWLRSLANAISYGLIPKEINTKRNLRKEYSYIPLHFMEEFCRKTSMSGFFIRNTENDFPIDNDEFLTKVRTYLRGYVFNDGKEWEFISDEKLQEIKKIKQIQEANGKKNVKIDAESEIERQEELKLKIETASNEELPTITLGEVVVQGLDTQKALRKLRGEYLHWSSNRKWFGMEPPNNNRKRKEHY